MPATKNFYDKTGFLSPRHSDSSKRFAASSGPLVVSFSLMAGNAGLLVKHGFHYTLETAVGLLWISSDYCLRQKNRHPIGAPRLNAAGVVLGSLTLSMSGFHAHWVDWARVRTPMGYIPAAAIVGFQDKIRRFGDDLLTSPSRPLIGAGLILQRPYTVAAVMNAYGVVELARSALALADRGLLIISAAYGLATLFLPALDLDCS